MPVEPLRRRVALAAALVASLLVACSRPSGPALPAATVAGTANPVASASGTVAPTATPSSTPAATSIATPVAGASVKVGDWTVVVAHFRAQVSEPDGVNIRSSPELKPDNRTGSLPAGATVDVEGSVAQGQEAVPGEGTNWYYLGTVGTSPPAPQFIYGPAGALTPISASATPAASVSASPAPTTSPTATPAPGQGMLFYNDPAESAWSEVRWR